MGTGCGEEDQAEQEKRGSPLWKSRKPESGPCAPNILMNSYFHLQRVIFSKTIVKYFRCNRRYNSYNFRQCGGGAFFLVSPSKYS